MITIILVAVIPAVLNHTGEVAGLCDGNAIVDLHGAVIHDVVVGISAAVRIVISVFLATGIRASVKHHHAAGLILDCRLAVGHIVHGAVAGDGQRAVVGDGMAAYIGQSSAVQIQGQLRILGDYDVLVGVFQQGHRNVLPGIVDCGLEGRIVPLVNLGGYVILRSIRSNCGSTALLFISKRTAGYIGSSFAFRVISRIESNEGSSVNFNSCLSIFVCDINTVYHILSIIRCR